MLFADDVHVHNGLMLARSSFGPMLVPFTQCDIMRRAILLFNCVAPSVYRSVRNFSMPTGITFSRHEEYHNKIYARVYEMLTLLPVPVVMKPLLWGCVKEEGSYQKPQPDDTPARENIAMAKASPNALEL